MGFNFPQTVMFPYEAILPVIWDGARTTNVSLYFASSPACWPGF